MGQKVSQELFRLGVYALIPRVDLLEVLDELGALFPLESVVVNGLLTIGRHISNLFQFFVDILNNLHLAIGDITSLV